MLKFQSKLPHSRSICHIHFAIMKAKSFINSVLVATITTLLPLYPFLVPPILIYWKLIIFFFYISHIFEMLVLFFFWSTDILISFGYHFLTFIFSPTILLVLPCWYRHWLFSFTRIMKEGWIEELFGYWNLYFIFSITYRKTVITGH